MRTIVRMYSSVRLVESEDTMMDEMKVMMNEKKIKKGLKLQMFTLLAFLLSLNFLFSACNAIQAIPGYSLSLFVSGDPSNQSPDGVAVDQGHVFIGYQNASDKEGADQNLSTIFEYDMHGKKV